jgi:enoyl-CoA hydratase/carnithine racemase
MTGIETEAIGDVWVVRIARPERRNALDKAAWEGLGDAVRNAPETARAIVVTGTTQVFSAGMDLKMDNPLLMEVGMAIGNKDVVKLRDIIVSLKGCLAPLREATVPTIAAIEGPCMGGGLEVALHCDVRIASDTAIFSMPEPRIGFVADVGGTTLLKRLIGPGRASWLITAAKRIDADHAERWGLVEQRCEAGQALDQALALAHEMAHGAPVATAGTLELLRSGPEVAFSTETEAGVQALLAGEAMEAVTARMEGRTPSWCPAPRTAE